LTEEERSSVGYTAETPEGWRTLVVVATSIVVTDATAPDHPFVYVNPAVVRATGETAAVVLAHNGRFLQGLGTDRRSVVTTLPPTPVTSAGSTHAGVTDARI